MLPVYLGIDDLDKDGQFVKLGRVALAIAVSNGSANLLDAERKIFAGINAAVQTKALIPRDPETLLPLSLKDYGVGIVTFEELVEWGRSTSLFDFRKDDERAETPFDPPELRNLMGKIKDLKYDKWECEAIIFEGRRVGRETPLADARLKEVASLLPSLMREYETKIAAHDGRRLRVAVAQKAKQADTAPSGAPKLRTGRPSDKAEKQRVVLSIVKAFEEVMGVFPGGELPQTKADFLDACQRLEKEKTGKTSLFGNATADTVSDWLRTGSYRFAPGKPIGNGKPYTSALPQIAGKSHDGLFPEVS